MPLKVRAKFVEQKEKRLAEMEIENPEKAEAQREKKRWQNAETRLKGEKVINRLIFSANFLALFGRNF